MKKSLLTLAVLSSFVGAAYAQSSVILSGALYGGIGIATGGPANGRTVGVAGPSSWMLRGQEDLGGGLSTIFKLESGFNTDTGAQTAGAPLFDKQAYMGITGGWGAVRMGRIYTPSFATLALVVDPTATYSVLSTTSLMETSGVRMDNGIVYNSPGFNPYTYARKGFYGALAYYFGEKEGNTNLNRTIGSNIGYAAGPLVVELSNHNSNSLATTTDSNNTLLGANYNFGVAKLFAGYGVNRSTNTVTGLKTKDNIDALIGVIIPIGVSTFTASYINKNDKLIGNDDASQIGFSYKYPLSKRTSLTAAYAKIKNQNTLKYKVYGAYAVGVGDTGYTLGIDHAF